ncbi:MAG: hypothetical protein HY265_05005 [Deltaproteobacteria bacterium]|nr:hypothetical protein [Deltaproteobacteria bacterium]
MPKTPPRTPIPRIDERPAAGSICKIEPARDGTEILGGCMKKGIIAIATLAVLSATAAYAEEHLS